MYKNHLYAKNRVFRPSIKLNFAGDKALPSLVTLTRASSGTCFDSAGVLQTATTNAARFTHDPATLESLGLLLEEQRTNLLTYSEEFDNAAWTKSDATISANAIAAPYGSTTADKITASATTGKHIAFHSVSTSVSNPFNYTIFAKKGEYDYIAISAVKLSNSFGILYTVSLVDGTVTLRSNSGFTSVSCASEYVGDGWWRCSLQFTNTGSDAADLVTVAPSPSATPSSDIFYKTVSYAGDGSSGIYLWRAQAEAGAFETSSILTTASTATRAADSASITGSNFSSWYNVSAGTFIVEVDARNAATVLTCGSTTITADTTGSKIYAATYATDQSASSLVLGKGTFKSVTYYPRVLSASELAFLGA